MRNILVIFCGTKFPWEPSGLILLFPCGTLFRHINNRNNHNNITGNALCDESAMLPTSLRVVHK